MKKFERVKAVVSLDAIAHNFAEMKKNIAKGTKIVAVIKADGYGHGAEAIARLIEDYDYILGICSCDTGGSIAASYLWCKKTDSDPWNRF